MTDDSFSVTSAKHAAHEGQLAEWVVEFLASPDSSTSAPAGLGTYFGQQATTIRCGHVVGSKFCERAVTHTNMASGHGLFVVGRGIHPRSSRFQARTTVSKCSTTGNGS
jgi:hypothetical protein